MTRLSSIILLFIVIIGSSTKSYSQAARLETFGKNRIQYRQFDWQYYEYDRQRIYYYDRGGRELARFVAELVERDVKAIERSMNGSFPPILNIVLFNNYDDYLQTNIGLETELEMSERQSGSLAFYGDKLLVYYNGKHEDLKKQLRSGIAKVILERALFGDDIKSIARNQLFQNIPQWITNGYVDHIVEGWDHESDEAMKQAIMYKKIRFEEIVRANPELAGRAFWKYISKRYGQQSVRNLFFNIISKNSLYKGILQTHQMKQRAIYDSIMVHYRGRYQFESQLTESPPVDSAIFTIVPKNKDVIIQSIKVSPRGNDIAYVSYENGVYLVHLEKTNKQKKTNERVKATVFRAGITDYTAEPNPDYPIISWSHTGFKLGIMYRRGSYIMLKVYDAIKGKMQNFKIRTNKLDRVLNFTFMEEDEMIIISGIKNGQSDLFEYRFKNGRINQLTDDTYDDLDPIYVMGGARRGILFLSNRQQPYMNIRPLPNELPNGAMNAFFYNTTTNSTELLRLTKYQKDFVTSVIPYGQDYFSYLSAETGIMNRYVILFNRDNNNMDTAYSVPVTNYNTNIISQQYNPASSSIAEALREGNIYNVYFRKIEIPEPYGTGSVKQPIYINTMDTSDLAKVDREKDSITIASGGAINITINNDFQTLFARSTVPPVDKKPTSDSINQFKSINDKQSSEDFAQQLMVTPADSSSNSIVRDYDADYDEQGRKILFVDSTYIKLRSKPYQRAFKVYEITGRIDNSYMFNRYQNYSGNFGRLVNPDLGALTLFQLKDRMEDYRLTAGFRITPNFNTSYLLKYENYRRRLDWAVTLFNNTQREVVDIFVMSQGAAQVYKTPLRNRTTTIQGTLSYPFNRVQRLSAYIAYRRDQGVFKAANPLAIVLPDIEEDYITNRLEFVHDDTKSVETNITRGSRYKVFGEYLWKFRSQGPPTTDTSSSKPETGGFYNFGFDYRYYKQIYKNITLAIRGAGAHSGGSHQILYMIGGVDNPLFPQYNDLLTPTKNTNYAFQALATNLRGYPQNARNGNTFLVLNTELRVPIYTTFFKRPIKNAFIRNLQVIGFLDVGSAWEGLIPNFSLQRDNVFYYPTPFNPQVVATIPYTKPNGFGVGYGIGLRNYIYSYYYRIDFASTIERDFRIHFSIGFDF